MPDTIGVDAEVPGPNVPEPAGVGAAGSDVLGVADILPSEPVINIDDIPNSMGQPVRLDEFEHDPRRAVAEDLTVAEPAAQDAHATGEAWYPPAEKAVWTWPRLEDRLVER